MRFLLKTLLLSMFVLMSAGAWADPVPNAEMVKTAKGAMTPLVKLDTFWSQPGESKDDFLMRVAAYMQSYTYFKQFEACGGIWETPDHTRWAVSLGTIEAQMSCLFSSHGPTDDSGTPWAYSGETIHSHPRQDQLKANAVDVLMGPFILGDVVSNHRRKFSPGDLAAGPGYLVAGRQLQYQRDGGKVHAVIGSL